MLAVGPVAALADAVFTNGFGVLTAPDVGSEGGVVGLAGEQAIQHVLDVGPHIQIVAHRTADQREEVRSALARRHTADE